MSRWIEVEPLIENFGKLTVELWLDSVEEAEIVSLIGNAPSIDLVRCGECKHNVGLRDGVEFWEEDITCDYWESDGLTADDFCSYGERRTK